MPSSARGCDAEPFVRGDVGIAPYEMTRTRFEKQNRRAGRPVPCNNRFLSFKNSLNSRNDIFKAFLFSFGIGNLYIEFKAVIQRFGI